MRKISLTLVLVLVMTLAACGSVQTGILYNQGKASEKSQPTVVKSVSILSDLIRMDNQGAVAISVEPLNLDSPGDTLKFEVSMNTHSVDLSLDLASLSTLSTDNGISVQGVAWDGAQGGHHVSGSLSFPASIDGKQILDGAMSLMLTIKNVDAPERIFTWDLAK